MEELIHEAKLNNMFNLGAIVTAGLCLCLIDDINVLRISVGAILVIAGIVNGFFRERLTE